MSKVKSSGMVSLLRSRLAAFLGQSHGGQRNMREIFGYPQEVVYEDLLEMYLRGGIASRIVRAFPQATWREMPVVRDEAGDSPKRDDEGYSPFAEAFEDLAERHRLSHHLERADRLAGIGSFGVLLVGVRDGLSLWEPLEPGRRAELLYLAPYPEGAVTIAEWETSTSSPRFGLPMMYNLQAGAVGSRQSSQRQAVRAHWTRVIHLAEFQDEDVVYGTPRLLPVYNHLLDLFKVVGSGAESFWLNARGGMALTTDPDARLDEAALAEVKKQAEEFEHQMRRILALQGIEASMLTTNIADPKPNVETLLDLIAGTVGMPKRILLGSERGELASSQDENNWDSRIDERRRNWAYPMALQPLVRMMIDTQNLPQPQGEWWPVAPEADAMGPDRQSEIAERRARALATYANSPSAELVVPVPEFRRDFLGLDPMSDYDEEDERTIREEESDSETPVAEVPEEERPQDQALNGAQIMALRDIALAVGEGIMAPETAIQLIVVGFPSVGEEIARRIVDPMDGFEIESLAETDAPPPAPPPPPPTTPEEAEAVRANLRRRVNRLMRTCATTPRTLYVRRDVLNADDILEHYRRQGVRVTLPPDRIHVTIAYSRTPLDWTRIAEDWSEDDMGRMTVAPGGMRLTELLGPTTPRRVLVLLFASSRLSWRHESIREAGASWDWPDYMPHITIARDAEESVALDEAADLEPWRGPIHLGPEIFEEVDEGWMREAAE